MGDAEVKHLIVGAGATFAQAIALGNPVETCPPLIRDFARKTWADYSPHPFLEVYLRQLGYEEFGRDPRVLFFELEGRGITNIERFMEFVWENRDSDFNVSDDPPPGFISGLRLTEAGAQIADVPITLWDDLLYHGIGRPLSFSMIQCFHENGIGWKNLDLTKSVASKFDHGDLILNLNYDTTFELALEQLACPFVYAPNKANREQLLVCKPHGSLNMVVNERSFTFGQPGWLGLPQPNGYRSFSGLMPPRLKKQYAQHPIAKMIVDSVRHRHPSQVVMWGVGLTESDTDLAALYSSWIGSTGSVEVINPSEEVATKAGTLFGCGVRHFTDANDWLSHSGKTP
jgi:hypothetical protein